MDVFKLHGDLIGDYVDYTRSFLRIKDERIDEEVRKAIDEGLLWPNPLLQLNPSFEPGDRIDELVDKGVLHPECSRIFRAKSSDDPVGKELRLHQHQSHAINMAREGKPYILTTGTGSGKSLAYIIPAVDHILRNGSGKGIQAIIVYPMNALANSQEEELKKFLELGYPSGGSPISFERYTGQEDREKRERIRTSPPDILLTNYMMLELMLTRVGERDLIRSAKQLRFLVLDELHTYRGRQGADVSMLVRRCRQAFSGDKMLCVGTSATMASGDDADAQVEAVAAVGKQMFGREVDPTQVIGETLRRTTQGYDFSEEACLAELRGRMQDPPPATADEFASHPLASWLESCFGLDTDQAGRLIRRTPRAVTDAARELAERTGADEASCKESIESYLLAGSKLRSPVTGFPVFAFRLHQFISRGDTVWASIEGPDERHFEFRKQVTVPGDEARRLFPMVFCRECGCAYYRVDWLKEGEEEGRFVPRELAEPTVEDGVQSGYLYVSPDAPWPDDEADIIDRIPDDWKEATADGGERIAPRSPLPQNLMVCPDGTLSEDAGIRATFSRAPFRMCLSPDCGIAYNARQRSDRLKLNTLGVDTRSTATTILALRAITALQEEEDLPDVARKLLSFTDNRQDASLQAGHFNDFAQIGLIRSALYRALVAAPEGLRHDQLASRVFDALDLPFELYASGPEVRGPAKQQTQAAMRDVLGYFLCRDLERGWRVTSPNLEQCGLLTFEYEGLDGEDGVLQDTEAWQAEELHPALREATTEQRRDVILALLDHLRRNLAIKTDALEQLWQEGMISRSRQRLRPGTPWYQEDIESLERSVTAWPRSRNRRDPKADIFISPRSSFGIYLRRLGTLPAGEDGKLSMADTGAIIGDLFKMLSRYGLIEACRQPRDGDEVVGYRLASAVMIWKPGTGDQVPIDRLRISRASKAPSESNPYFVSFFKRFAGTAGTIEAREHTAQVDSEERQIREQRFRNAELPVLFCSPTMELGVDISQLNLVNMRNVPPTPANYAQRSGRAGRSGQPALVYTYCSGFSPHDQYYFRQPERMVAGVVAAPRIELHNEHLVRSHVHALWLSASELALGETLCDVLEVSEDDLTLPLKDKVREALVSTAARFSARDSARHLIDSIGLTAEVAPWYREGWLDDVLSQLPQSFDRACDRWRGLYRSAVYQRNYQHEVIGDHGRKPQDRDRAKRLRAEAEAQIKILTTARGAYEGDFYSYRYFASEGFLPGYNFPRLPLSAFIPGRRGPKGRDEYLSRPRFLAISEFGPRAIIYHEGVRYTVNKVSLDQDLSQSDLATSTMKRCAACGYGHFSEQGTQNDVCDLCGSAMTPDSYRQGLARMQNVSAKRANRITCDEEERRRKGYRIETSFRFAEGPEGRLYRRDAKVMSGEAVVGRLSYGDAATIWRVNLGWSQKADSQPDGFLLDIDRGYWATRKSDIEDAEDPMSDRKKWVVPYVDDHKNVLIFTPETPLDDGEMASLQAAFKEAIQKRFQLEPMELATIPLPGRDDRRSILFYESSEGGAGVLRQLVDNKAALGEVAREALVICHFDADTGDDLFEAGKGACGAACYDCLLDYANQPEHELLSRYQIKPFLQRLMNATVIPSSVVGDREDHLAHMMAMCDSKLERRWLQTVQDQSLRLPTHAQFLIESCVTRPDFYYEEHRAAIYVDGPPHDNPEAQAHDKEITAALISKGYLVIRFHHKDDWEAIFGKYTDVFGESR